MNVDYTEKMAQAYVKHGADIVAAWPEVYPPGSTMHAKSRKVIERKFKEAWGDNKKFWFRVAALQAIADAQIAVSAADVVNHWKLVALADRRRLVGVKQVKVACRSCGDVGCENCPPAVPVVEIVPTEDYGPAEVAIYEGAEQTKNGIKILMASKEKAWENLARYFGLLDGTKSPKEDATHILPPLPQDPTEASRAYAEWVKGL